MNQGGDAEEVALPSGCLTLGVVRVADTVRRPRSAASEFTARLLRHFADVGFEGVPEFLGSDDKGRDTLRFIPGLVPPRWQTFSDEQVRSVGRLLRAFHDATRGSKLAGDHPVVCHNDPGPNNVVFQNERPAAFIDFDLAEPGLPVEDLGYLAWSWCIASKPSRLPLSKQVAQVCILADAYGVDADQRRALPDAILERQQRNIVFWKHRQHEGLQGPASPERIQEIIQWSRRESAFTRVNIAEFRQALESAAPHA